MNDCELFMQRTSHESFCLPQTKLVGPQELKLEEEKAPHTLGKVEKGGMEREKSSGVLDESVQSIKSILSSVWKQCG